MCSLTTRKATRHKWVRGIGLEEPAYERSPHVASLADNRLERILQHVRRDPVQRPRFYQQLLDSDVLVPVQASHHDRGCGIVPAGTTLDVITLVRSDGVGVISFFLSPARLYQWSLAGEQCVLRGTNPVRATRNNLNEYLSSLPTLAHVSISLNLGLPSCQIRVGSDPNPIHAGLYGLQYCDHVIA